jgi:DNA polymerase-3 subunit gamma/tau
MRDGLSLLDQAIAFGGGRLAMDDLEKMLGLVDHEHVASIIRALATDDAEGMLAIVSELVALSRDLDTVLLNLAEVLHRVTLVQCVPGYSDPERSDWPTIEKLADALSTEDAQLFYQVAIKGRDELGLAPDPRTGLEMTLLRMLAFRPAGTGTPAVSAPGGSRSKQAKTGSVKNVPASTSAARSAAPRPSARKKTEAPASLQDDSSSPAEAESDDEWARLQQQLDINGQVKELARNIELRSNDGGRWVFEIPSAVKHLASRACIERLQQAIFGLVGTEVSVRVLEAGREELRTVAAEEQRQVHQSMSEAERAINEDPTVKALKDKMGARIIEDTIQPIQ